jgi:DNA-binding transcriptional ArsR family regulator
LTLTPELLELIAGRFKALAEPARLHILANLRGGTRTVGELAVAVELGQANVSKHLQVLHAHRFVSRRKDGLYVRYSLADRSVFQLCDLMCGRIEAEVRARHKLLSA